MTPKIHSSTRACFWGFPKAFFHSFFNGAIRTIRTISNTIQSSDY
jgi:hypothetical protein